MLCLSLFKLYDIILIKNYKRYLRLSIVPKELSDLKVPSPTQSTTATKAMQVLPSVSTFPLSRQFFFPEQISSRQDQHLPKGRGADGDRSHWPLTLTSHCDKQWSLWQSPNWHHQYRQQKRFSRTCVCIYHGVCPTRAMTIKKKNGMNRYRIYLFFLVIFSKTITNLNYVD